MHNISQNSVTGRYEMFTAGALPWHSLGANVSEAPTWEKAIELAGINYPIIEAPIYTKWSVSGDRKMKRFKAILRGDTKEELAVHGMGYKIFQNVDLFRMCDSLIENGARYESAGALGIGERVWVLARIPAADFSIGDDKHEAYLLGVTSHDGSLMTTFMVTTVRVVCHNTLTAALGSNAKEDGRLKIKHTKGADEKLIQAQRMIAGTIQSAGSLRSKLTKLSERKVTKENVVTILNRLFPATSDATVSSTRRENVLSTVLSHFAHNDGNAFPEQQGTAYALLNAITDYADHDRSTRKTGDNQTDVSARAESALFGSGAKLKTAAMDTIYDVMLKDGTSVPMAMTVNPDLPNDGGLLDSIIQATSKR